MFSRISLQKTISIRNLNYRTTPNALKEILQANSIIMPLANRGIDSNVPSKNKGFAFAQVDDDKYEALLANKSIVLDDNTLYINERTAPRIPPNEQPSNILYVGNLINAQVEDLETIFGKQDIKMMVSGSFAFISYPSVKLAMEAKEQHLNAEINGVLIKIGFARPKPENKPKVTGHVTPKVGSADEKPFRNIFISGIAEETKARELIELFDPLELDFVRTAEGLSKGIAFMLLDESKIEEVLAKEFTLNGSRLNVKFQIENVASAGYIESQSLHIANLTKNVSVKQLEDIFKTPNITIKSSNKDGAFAFARYGSTEQARARKLELADLVIEGASIKITYGLQAPKGPSQPSE